MDQFTIIHDRVRDVHGEDSAIMGDGGIWLSGSQRFLTAEEAEAVTPSALEAERAGMVCSRMQARLAMHGAGILAAVEAAVAASGPEVQIAWADAVEFRRNSPTIAALAGAIDPPLSDEAVDDLFRVAMGLTA
jgi:hypothetical protein